MVDLPLDKPRMRTFAALWRQIQDLPRHLGQHSGGMVICQDALDAVVPLEPPTITPWRAQAPKIHASFVG